MSEHAAAIAVLEDFLASLPRDHVDRLGVIRAIEVLRYPTKKESA